MQYFTSWPESKEIADYALIFPNHLFQYFPLNVYCQEYIVIRQMRNLSQEPISQKMKFLELLDNDLRTSHTTKNV